jgi:hypothetical protein
MGLYPKNINEYLSLIGIPRGPSSQVYLVDPVNGSDSYDGIRWTKPLASVAAGYAKCVADQHDTVVMLSGDTADTPSSSITWSKDFTHLVGLSSDLPGVGQRCRIVGSADADLTPIVTFSGKGCIVRNIQFFNGKDADSDSGAVIVSGDRNAFTNVFFAGMGHATPAARAGSYSLTLSGEENVFTRCTIGLDTIKRAAANAELVVSGGARNTFEQCLFQSYCETVGKFLVKITSLDRWIRFRDCTFYNFWENWVDQLTNAISDGVGSTHYILLEGSNLLVGVDGWADTVDYIFSAGPVPNAGFGIGTNPTS